MSDLDDGGRLRSDLWLDRPDALQRIGDRLDGGEISPLQAEKLRQFVTRGFFTVPLSLEGGICEDLTRDVDLVWKRKPIDLAYTFLGEPASMADSREWWERVAPYRLLDLHSHSEAARKLYLDRALFAWIDLVFGQPSIAFQSAYSEFGRSEAPCRDLAFIEATPAAHLLTAWIALEDMKAESGALYIVAGSHRVPLYQFSAGRFRIRPGEDHLPAQRFVMARAGEAGLREETVLNRRGEATIWHPAVAHGFRRALRPQASRRALTVRYSTLANCRRRTASYWKTVRGRLWRREPRFFWSETDRILESGECRGIDNPLRGLKPRGLSVREKIRLALFGPPR
jgi:phytanoyl-CoA hydroxylase